MKLDDIVTVSQSLSEALEMVGDALVVAGKAIEGNPTRSERRALEASCLELQAKQVKLQDRMLAVGRGLMTMRPPSAPQIAEIKRLAREVDDLTRAAVTGTMAVSATGRVLDMVAEAGLV